MLSEDRFIRYRRPSGVEHVLDCAPRLESWEAKASREQRQLREYEDHVEALLRDATAGVGALALGLHVQVDESARTSGGRDLDNYLLPVVRRVGADRVWTAWAAKGAGPSTILAAPAVVDPHELPAWTFRGALTTVSAETTAWKASIAEQIADVDALPEGPVEVHVAFRLSEKRNWTALWKPAIDALGSVLGVPDPTRPFHTNDDRIVELALHRVVDESLGWNVELGLWWRSSPA